MFNAVHASTIFGGSICPKIVMSLVGLNWSLKERSLLHVMDIPWMHFTTILWFLVGIVRKGIFSTMFSSLTQLIINGKGLVMQVWTDDNRDCAQRPLLSRCSNSLPIRWDRGVRREDQEQPYRAYLYIETKWEGDGSGHQWRRHWGL